MPTQYGSPKPSAVAPAQRGVTATLTDGTGISALTGSKVLKDFVLDFLLTAAAALGAGATLDALDIGSIVQAPEAATIAIAGALIRTIYRAAIRWASSS